MECLKVALSPYYWQAARQKAEKLAAGKTRKDNKKRGENIKVVENFLRQEIRQLVERVESKKAQKESSIARLWGKMKEKAESME